MNSDQTPTGPPAATPATPTWPRTLLALALIALAGLVVYADSLSCPFVFDDVPAIVDNPSIRHLWPIGPVLAPPANAGGVGGRPLLNLSFAINYAVGGLDVRGYHALNVLLHVLTAWVLFAVIRRTLRRMNGGRSVAPRARDDTPWLLALAAAGLWTVHPLLTESVTAVVNRADILGALFYLLTLYAFIRGAEVADAGRSGRAWRLASVAACLAGMASKEWVVSAPVMVWLYDRTFVAGAFRAAWSRRRRYYAALASTWLLLALLMIGSNHRNDTVGFGLGVSAWAYAVTQCQAIIRYLGLSVWPHPLVFDYGRYLVKDAWTVLPQALGLLALGGGTVVALWRRPRLGFLGACFFAILAPSSSFIPLVTQTMAEHRMYLPLAAVVVLGVVGGYRLAGRRILLLGAVLAVAFGWLTVRRNRDFRSEFAIWSDTVAKWPDNVRILQRLGVLQLKAGHYDEAVRRDRQALRLDPYNPEVLDTLGHALYLAGRLPEAAAAYREALRLKPDFYAVDNNLGIILMHQGHLAEARARFEDALRVKPDYDEAHNNLGIVLMRTGHHHAALAQFETAARINPDFVDAQVNLGNALQEAGRAAEAVGHYERALRLKPNLVDAHFNLAYTLLDLGKPVEAAAQFRAVLRLKPNNREARDMLRRLGAVPAP